MKIDILKTTIVGEIKREFSAAYPYLKLEFFKSKTGKIARDKDILSKVQPSMREGSIKINETMKVKDLEDLFGSDFLLNAQVFRQSGTMWLETTVTDNWTLVRQNEYGRELTQTPKPAVASENEYELMRDQD